MKVSGRGDPLYTIHFLFQLDQSMSSHAGLAPVLLRFKFQEPSGIAEFSSLLRCDLSGHSLPPQQGMVIEIQLSDWGVWSQLQANLL